MRVNQDATGFTSKTTLSQGKLVEQSTCNDALYSLSSLRIAVATTESNQLADFLDSQSPRIDDSEHGPVLVFLAVLVVDEKRNRMGASSLCEIAQIQECALREVGDV